jgi:hypothetical protein
MYGDEYDDDDQATMSEDEDLDQADDEDEGAEDADAYASAAPPDDDDLLAEVIDLLGSKMGVHIPPHVSLDTFLRDLCLALHGHPGYDFGGEDQGEDDEATSATMSAGRRRRRRQKRKQQMSQPRRQPTSRGVNAARGRAAAAEQLRNAGMAK